MRDVGIARFSCSYSSYRVCVYVCVEERRWIFLLPSVSLLTKPPARIYEMKKSDPLSKTPVDFLDVQIKLNGYTDFNESPLKLSSPIFKTVIHDVSLIGGFQQSPPGQEDRRGWYRPNDHVEGLFQLHFTWEQMSSLTYLFTYPHVWWPCFHLNADLFPLYNQWRSITCALLFHLVCWDRLDGDKILWLSIWRQKIKLVVINLLLTAILFLSQLKKGKSCLLPNSVSYGFPSSGSWMNCRENMLLP